MNRPYSIDVRPDVSSSPLVYRDAQKVFLADYLERLLFHAGGSVTKAAKLAELDRTHVYDLLDRTGMGKEILARVREQI
jgi:DNA-binding NtrC family response regulator